jgi:hypothetical protein
MTQGSVEKLKEKLEEIRFGILKISGIPFLKISKSFIADTCKVDYDGYLWCTIPDTVPFGLSDGKAFTTQLKYVQKQEGLFIKVIGQAMTVKNGWRGEAKTFEKENLINSNDNTTLIKIKIEEVQYYRKKSISACTSFLQAINILTLNPLY